MPVNNNVIFDVIPLQNRHWSGNIQELAKLVAEHLIGQFATGAFIGQEGGIEPTVNIGSWLYHNIWFSWNIAAGKYIPFPLVSGNLAGTPPTVRYTTLIPKATNTNVVLFLPDQNGATLATLDDIEEVQGENETETHAGATITLDMSSKTRFYVNLTGNATINRTGDLKDGQIVDVYFQTPASSGPYTLTWNAADFYSVSGSGLSAADSSHMSVTRARAHVVGSAVYVEYEETFTVPTTNDVTGPQFVSVTAQEGVNELVVLFNELVNAATLSTSGWVVTKNGNNNLITAVEAKGSKAIITLASHYLPTDVGTVAYIGTDLKDVAGNAAPVFSSSALTIVPEAPSSTPDPATVNLITGI